MGQIGVYIGYNYVVLLRLLLPKGGCGKADHHRRLVTFQVIGHSDPFREFFICGDCGFKELTQHICMSHGRRDGGGWIGLWQRNPAKKPKSKHHCSRFHPQVGTFMVDL